MLKLKPIKDKIVIEKEEQISKTESGIFIPDNAKEKSNIGLIVAAGPGKTTDEGVLIPMSVNVGDRVVFTKYSGSEINLDGKEYLIITEADVLSVLE